MSVPPLRKWRPCVYFSGWKKRNWMFCIHPHRDYNPIFTIQNFHGEWFFEIGRVEYQTESGWRLRPRYF